MNWTLLIDLKTVILLSLSLSSVLCNEIDVSLVTIS